MLKHQQVMFAQSRYTLIPGISTSPQIESPLPLFCRRVLRQQTVLVVSNDKQLAINSFKHYTLTIQMDGSEDMLIHCLRPNQPCAAGLNS